MIDISDYMKRSKVERQSHLQLNEPCIERGCNSQACRGLLAHVLDTTVPKGLKVVLCHACHNSKCNSPNHLYWGTAAENVADTMANGGLTFEEKIKAKHGTEGFKKIMTANANKRWQKK